MKFVPIKVTPLGITEEWVYDLEVEDTHTFFGSRSGFPMLLHNSNYVSFGRVFKQLGITFDKKIHWVKTAYNLIEQVMNPYIDEILTIYAEKYGHEKIIVLKREKIIWAMFNTGIKHYITETLDCEGETHYELDKDGNIVIDEDGEQCIESEYDNTGIETKKSNTPDFIEVALEEVLKMILWGKSKKEVISELKASRSLYEGASIENIAIRGTCKEYRKHNRKEYYTIDGINFNATFWDDEAQQFDSVNKPPMRNRAAIMYNYICDELGLTNRLKIDDKMSMSYIKVKDTNRWHTNVIGFMGDFPEEFKPYFEIDYDEMWYSTATSLIEGWFESMCWGTPDFIDELELGGFTEGIVKAPPPSKKKIKKIDTSVKDELANLLDNFLGF